MTPRPNAVRIGLFAVIGLGLLVAALVSVWGGRSDGARTEPAVMHFSGSVYGLQVGSPVVFRGVRLGQRAGHGLCARKRLRFAVPVVAALNREPAFMT